MLYRSLFLLLTCLPALAQQTPAGFEKNMELGMTYPIGMNGLSARAVGDVDGDGLTDIGVAALSIFAGNPNVQILSGDSGALLRTIAVPINGLAGAAFIENAGDFDGDGREDQLVNVSGENLFVHSGASGALLLQLPGPGGTSYANRAVGVGDINGDTFDDFLVSDPIFNFVEVRAGQSGALLGTLTGTNPQDGYGKDLLSMGDINADGVNDFAIMAHVPSNGTGGYVDVVSGAILAVKYRITFNPTQREGRMVTVEDQNGDGVRDLALGLLDMNGAAPGEIRIFSGHSGTLLATLVGPVGAQHVRFGPYLEDVGDLDGDGRTDLLVHVPDPTTMGSGYFQIRSGAGLAVVNSFAYAHPLGSNWPVQSNSLGDLNGDGRAEFCIKGFTSPGAVGSANASVFGIERTTVSSTTVSSSAGGTVVFNFDYRKPAHQVILLGSMTGNSGASLLGYSIPLTPDAYYFAIPSIPTYQTTLNGSGQGSVTLTAPPGLPIGLTIYHAPVVYNPLAFPPLDVRFEAIETHVVP